MQAYAPELTRPDRLDNATGDCHVVRIIISWSAPTSFQKEVSARVFRATFSIGSAVAPLRVAGVVPPPIPSANGPIRVLGKMAAIECAVGSTPCLPRRLGDQETVRRAVAVWETTRHAAKATVEWCVTTANARRKLKHIYPK